VLHFFDKKKNSTEGVPPGGVKKAMNHRGKRISDGAEPNRLT